MNDVLFEIGVEELPARFIDDAEKQLVDKTKQWLTELRIDYDSISSFSTPRRLAVIIHQIADQQKSIREEVRGPSEKIAKDEEGNWTKAAIGFTKGQNKTTDDIYVKEVNGTNYVFVEKFIEGKPTIDLLPSFKNIIESIHFPESMRWGTESITFSRPIRWLVALYNDQIIPFTIANVKTSNKTYGHRFLGNEIAIKDPLTYEEKLADHFVIANATNREQLIIQQIKELEKKENFQIIVEKNLLQEVRNLVEYPTVFFGTFAEKYLQLPAEVLITSMQEHQRYFPVQAEDGTLLPYFIGVRNGDSEAIEQVIKGNEKVLRARLADAEFFYAEDQKQSIRFYNEKLTRVVFHEKLGTVSEKVKRVKQNAQQIATMLNLRDDMIEQVGYAAEISKFDLMSNMVNEFPELQGIMGEKYALLMGEELEVAQAIKEHYLPIKSAGNLPQSIYGAILSIADKIDTIIGMISIGLTPTGSQDPYSLRRQAIGVLRILADKKWPMTIEDLCDLALRSYKQTADEKVKEEVIHFFKQRASFLLREMDIEQDVIDALLKNNIGNFAYVISKAEVLSAKRNDLEFKDTQEALVRVINLAKQNIDEQKINPALFETESEEALYTAYKQVVSRYEQAINNYQAEDAMACLSELTKVIHDFFENNMVMADDEQIKMNRLTLIHLIARMIHDFADLSMIQWRQHS